MKKTEVEAAILSFRARQHLIYATYTPIPITCLIFKVNQNAARLNYLSEDIQHLGAIYTEVGAIYSEVGAIYSEVGAIYYI